MRVLPTVALLSGCAYQAGSFTSTTRPFAGQRLTIDCLDLSIQRRPDLPTGEAVIAYAFGNRCDHPVTVDLSTVNVVGREVDGREWTLTPYDPRHELQPLGLDGRAVGGEALAYSSDAVFDQVCIEAGSITHAPTVHWSCHTSSPSITETP